MKPLAYLLLTILASCANSGAKVSELRSLPKAPSYMSPVELPDNSTNAKADLAICTGHVTALNSRLIRSGEWYQNIQQKYRSK